MSGAYRRVGICTVGGKVYEVGADGGCVSLWACHDGIETHLVLPPVEAARLGSLFAQASVTAREQRALLVGVA